MTEPLVRIAENTDGVFWALVGNGFFLIGIWIQLVQIHTILRSKNGKL